MIHVESPDWMAAYDLLNTSTMREFSCRPECKTYADCNLYCPYCAADRWRREKSRCDAAEIRNGYRCFYPVIVYGAGGWSRYYVQDDGEVVFSARHAQHWVEDAKKLGFTIQY